MVTAVISPCRALMFTGTDHSCRSRPSEPSALTSNGYSGRSGGSRPSGSSPLTIRAVSVSAVVVTAVISLLNAVRRVLVSTSTNRSGRSRQCKPSALRTRAVSVSVMVLMAVISLCRLLVSSSTDRSGCSRPSGPSAFKSNDHTDRSGRSRQCKPVGVDDASSVSVDGGGDGGDQPMSCARVQQHRSQRLQPTVWAVGVDQR